MRTLLRSLMVVVVALLTVSAQPARPAPRKLEIAPGVYVFMTAPYGAVGLDGNAIVVTSKDGVLVFDANGTPSAAEAVLREIRAVTTQPVRYLVYSHWHWDHWYGGEVYARAFPDITIISHEKTRAMMQGPALAFNKPGLDAQLPAYIASLDKRIAAGESATPPADTLPALKQARDEATFFLEQKRSVHHTVATRTFTDRLDLTLGDRPVQILNYGRAVTPGDALMYLPKERVLVTGDLLVNPITFALSSYPTEWLTALERLDRLDATVIVTGHGEPLHDKALLHDTMAVFRLLLREGKVMRDKGLDADHAKEAVLPQLHELMVQITGNVPARNDAFRTQLVDWYLHRVYDELSGPLGDDIAAIPPQ